VINEKQKTTTNVRTTYSQSISNPKIGNNKRHHLCSLQSDISSLCKAIKQHIVNNIRRYICNIYLYLYKAVSCRVLSSW